MKNCKKKGILALIARRLVYGLTLTFMAEIKATAEETPPTLI